MDAFLMFAEIHAMVAVWWIKANMSFVIWWYTIGLILSFVWPVHYRKYMKRRDWWSVVKAAPFLALFGPLAIILSFPI